MAVFIRSAVTLSASDGDGSGVDNYPDRDGYASWGNSCGGDADDL